MKRKFTALFAAFLLLITGCDAPAGTQESDAGEGNDTIEIGMSFDSFVIERWQRDRDVFVSTAKELGATVNVQNAYGDVERQREQIEYFIAKGVDVIVIICIDSERRSKKPRMPESRS